MVGTGIVYIVTGPVYSVTGPVSEDTGTIHLDPIPDNRIVECGQDRKQKTELFKHDMVMEVKLPFPIMSFIIYTLYVDIKSKIE